MQEARPKPAWRPFTRVAFRFSLIYLGTFALASQIAGSMFLVPGVSFRGMGQVWPMRELSVWIAESVFGVSGPFDSSSANGETVFFVAQTVWILAVALVGTAIWSVLDRHRASYPLVHAGFRLFLRLGLAAQMFEYGMTKIIPNQFEAPSLTILSTRAGDLSLNTMLWTSIGASTGYQIFTGAVEMLGGILLLVPRTTLAGALISTAALVQVFVLNLTYDIGLKLTSLHLILLGLFLVAPDLQRLSRFFLDRPVEGPRRAALFEGRQAKRMAFALQVLFGLYLTTFQAYLNVDYWYRVGGGAPRSELYGIWEVEDLAVDGVSGPPSLNDYDRRWRRVIFDGAASASFQRTDDSFARYDASIEPDDGTLILSRGGSETWEAVFSYERSGEDGLILEGEMDGLDIRLRLQRIEFDSFRLLNSHFRWIRPPSR